MMNDKKYIMEDDLESEDAEVKALTAELRKEFGKRVHFLRRHLDMSQEQLAEAVKKSPTFISLLETGASAPSFKTIIRLTKVFNVKVIDLFRFDKSIPWKQDAPDDAE